MEELGPIIMFILYVLYIIFGGSGKKKKRQNQPPIFDQESAKQAPAKTPSKKRPSSLEEYLKEIVEQSSPQKKVVQQPVVKKEKTASEAMDFKGERRTYKKSAKSKGQLFDDSKKQSQKFPSVKKDTSTLQDKIDAMNKKAISELKNENDSMELALEENANFVSEKLSNFQFDPVDAVIYTEIFQRKY